MCDETKLSLDVGDVEMNGQTSGAHRSFVIPTKVGIWSKIEVPIFIGTTELRT